MHDWFKSYKNFDPVFFKNQKLQTSVPIWEARRQQGMRGVYPEPIDWSIALRTQISFWVSVSEEKALSDYQNLQNWPDFLKCFWEPISDMLAQNEI